MDPLVSGPVKDDSRASSYLPEYNLLTFLLILLLHMFLSLRAMPVFYRIISDLNLLFYKLSYLVKNPYTFRPVGEEISSLTNLILFFFWFTDFGGQSSQIAVPHEKLFPDWTWLSLISLRLCSVPFSEPFCAHTVNNNDTVTPMLALVFPSPFIWIYC